MSYDETKWKREKVEAIMKSHNIVFESNDTGCYFDSYFEFYGKKIRIKILVYKTVINIDCGWSYSNGITSYKKLNEVIENYKKSRKKDTWRELSFAERISYHAKVDCEKTGKTEFAESIINIFEKSINSNLNELSSSINNKDY